MKLIARLIAVAFLLAFPAAAQEASKEVNQSPPAKLEKQVDEPECTPAYIRKLEERYRQNKTLRDWTTNPVGAGCRVVDFTERIGGEVAERTGLKKLWEKIPGTSKVDPRLTSKTCDYARELIDNQISTEEDGARLRKEIKRCTGAHVIN